MPQSLMVKVFNHAHQYYSLGIRLFFGTIPGEAERSAFQHDACDECPHVSWQNSFFGRFLWHISIYSNVETSGNRAKVETRVCSVPEVNQHSSPVTGPSTERKQNVFVTHTHILFKPSPTC